MFEDNPYLSFVAYLKTQSEERKVLLQKDVKNFEAFLKKTLLSPLMTAGLSELIVNEDLEKEAMSLLKSAMSMYITRVAFSILENEEVFSSEEQGQDDEQIL